MPCFLLIESKYTIQNPKREKQLELQLKAQDFVLNALRCNKWEFMWIYITMKKTCCFGVFNALPVGKNVAVVSPIWKGVDFSNGGVDSFLAALNTCPLNKKELTLLFCPPEYRVKNEVFRASFEG